jgi:flagellar biosynthesis chaperone FliJ
MAYCQGCADSERQVDMLKTLLSEARAALADAERQLQEFAGERDEARSIVAGVNNSVFGSQGYFTRPDCVDAIEASKFHHNSAIRRAEAAESKLTETEGKLRTLVEEMRFKQHDFARKADDIDTRGNPLYANKLAAASEATALWADKIEALLPPERDTPEQT